MTKEELGIAIDEAFASDKIEETDRIKQEKELFRQAILLQQEASGLIRTPSSIQIKRSWQRWKRERFLEVGSEPGINTKELFKRKK